MAAVEERRKVRRSIPGIIIIDCEGNMETGRLPLLINAAATLYMTGLIWFVQVVHYPLFGRVGEVGYRQYQVAHQNLTSLVVGPAMLAELVSAIWVVWADTKDPWRWVGLAAVGALWASTALVQMPLHATLAEGFDSAAHARLVASNWVRTVLWTGRSGLALWLIARAWQSR
jgi:hypothetical protein